MKKQKKPMTAPFRTLSAFIKTADPQKEKQIIRKISLFFSSSPKKKTGDETLSISS
jgi:hypothetical protein